MAARKKLLIVFIARRPTAQTAARCIDLELALYQYNLPLREA